MNWWIKDYELIKHNLNCGIKECEETFLGWKWGIKDCKPT